MNPRDLCRELFGVLLLIGAGAEQFTQKPAMPFAEQQDGLGAGEFRTERGAARVQMRPSQEAFAGALRDFTVGGGTVLLVAGLLEGFGRQLITTEAARYAIGLSMLALWCAYFFLPRRATG